MIVAEFHVAETSQPYAPLIVGRLVGEEPFAGISFSTHTDLGDVAELLKRYLEERLK